MTASPATGAASDDAHQPAGREADPGEARRGQAEDPGAGDRRDDVATLRRDGDRRR